GEPAGVRAGVEHQRGQQDHPRAGPVDGQPVAEAFRDRALHPVGVQEPAHRRGFAARQDQAVHLTEFAGAPYRHRPGTCTLQVAEVPGDVTLEGEHTDRGRRGAHVRSTPSAPPEVVSTGNDCAPGRRRRDSPSCVTAATSRPDRSKMRPWVSVLPPNADGEVWSYNSQSSARKGRRNHIAGASEASWVGAPGCATSAELTMVISDMYAMGDTRELG